MEKNLSAFTNQYQVSKTLRFELIPQGKTLEHIQKKGLINEDEKRAKDYKKVKKIIDKYHKVFINKSLKDVKLIKLKEFQKLYIKNKDENEKKEYEALQDNLRKQIADIFVKNGVNNLFKKELIKDDLNKAVDLSGDSLLDDEEKELVETFKNFTTYFTGFHENRKNIYTNKKKTTAISYRLIHDNLPTFIDNLIVFEKVKKSSIKLSEISKNLKSILKKDKLEDLFSINFYNKCITQVDIEYYNTLLGGISKEGKQKIKGLNEYINLYNQKAKKEDRLPKLKQLYKQILSDSDTASFVFDEFESDNELLENLQSFYSSFIQNFDIGGKTENLLDVLEKLLYKLDTYDLEKIYLKNDTTRTGISNKLYSDWSIIASALQDYYNNNLLSKKVKITKKDYKDRDNWLKQSHSIEIIDTALKEYDNEVIRENDIEKPLVKYFQKLGKGEDNKTLIEKIHDNYNNIKDLLNIEYSIEKRLTANGEAKAKIKSFLDSIMDIIHFIKPLDLARKDIEKDIHFYNTFDALYEQLNQIIRIYNKVRNYLTKKPYSTEKIKLNFDNSTLLDGWDLNKESDNTCVLFIKNELYYLGIINKQNNKVFENYKEPTNTKNKDFYNKMAYKLLPGPNKMLPKVFFSNKRINEFAPGKEILKNYKNNTHKKGETFKIEDCHKLIDFFKRSIKKHEDWKNFNHIFSDTKSYQDLSEFYKEVAHQGYKISFQNIEDDYIDELVNQGKLYLFQIYNKDFSQNSKGKPNLHTIYWKMLFDENNLANVVYKLNGQAEVFYRKKSLKEKETTVHKANKPIKLRTEDEASKKRSYFPYDIIKDKRFTLDKFQFHVPITLNFKAEGNERLNNNVNRFLKNNPGVNIIGLDRGERHLIYLTLINQKGEILHQESLNEVLGVNYQEKLDNVEKSRTRERKNWEEIENIKELKSGYLSQVVHKIAKMMVEHNAIIVMEDLNFGFKRGRIKVEKQVYQKFEKALIDKLNYLVFKGEKDEKPGGALKALQLTNKFESFQKLGKQCGFIFYVGADYTSKIDPATGFVNLLYPKYESVEKSKKFFSNFNSINYKQQKDYFEFSFDYSNFTDRAEGTKLNWTVCTVGSERYYYNWKTKKTSTVNVTEELKTLLNKHNIAFDDGENIIEDIILNNTKDLYYNLSWLLKLTLSMRQSITNTDIDYIFSPVIAKNGQFFDSRKANEKLPQNADANGAYNIALKGLMVLEKINKAKDIDKLKFKDMAINNKEWIKFAQERF